LFLKHWQIHCCHPLSGKQFWSVNHWYEYLSVDLNTGQESLDKGFHGFALKQIPNLPCQIEVGVRAKEVILFLAFVFEEEVVGGVEPKIEIFLYCRLVDVGFAYEGIAESDILVEAFV